MTDPTQKYLAQYPASLREQVRHLIVSGRAREWLQARFEGPSGVANDRSLYDYTMELKQRYLKTAPPLSKVCFDEKLATLQRALGQHAYVSRVQGGRLKSKNEIRIAGLFRHAPPEFLRTVVVHELAHLRERDHNRAFYQLCCRMEPNYHDYEFALRLYLTSEGY